MHMLKIGMPLRIPPLTINVGSLWHDEELNITYRPIGITAIGIDVRCISNDTGKVWSDRLARECFNELVQVKS